MIDVSRGRDKEPSTSSSSKKRKHETGGVLIDDTELRQTVNSSKETVADGGVTKTVSHGHDDRFKDVCIEDIIILEICAGSARLTKAARGQGFRGVAIDHSNKRSCGVDICIFDLTDPAQLEDLLEYIRRDADRISLIWVAPPCGTASRARERPIPGQSNCPKPLRSTNQPDALDGLTGLEKIKVEMANQLYDAVYKITECAVSCSICVAIENPTNSHYWSTSPTRLILEQFGDNRITFHSCAHGGTRDKSTSIWQSQPWFDSLALLCDGRHRHDSWRPRLQNGKMTYPIRHPKLLILNCCVNESLLVSSVLCFLEGPSQLTIFMRKTNCKSRHSRDVLLWGRCQGVQKSSRLLLNFKNLKFFIAIRNNNQDRLNLFCTHCQRVLE